MGPLRGGLILSLFASPAFAAVCDTARPNWNGTPATAVSEALYLFMSPVSLFLIAALCVAVIFRHKMGATITVLLWSFYLSFVIFPDQTGGTAIAMQEGCIGSPTLYIALSAVLSIAAIAYVFKGATSE